MSNNYDNWERLMEVVLRREKDREVALANSRESSLRSISSTFSFGPGSSFHEQNPQLEAYNSNTVNLLGDKMGQNGSHFEPRRDPPPLPNKCDWEIDADELDFASSTIIGKSGFRHEVNLLVKLRHPNIVQFLGAVTERRPLMLITEYLRWEKGALNPSTAISFALDIARGMAYLHGEPNVIIHRDLKPRNVILVNSNADHLKVGDFGSSKLITVQNSNDVYKMTGETGSYRYMAPEVFKHRKYDKKVDVFSSAMILYEMLEGEPPLAHYGPYEVARYVAEGHRPVFRAKGFIPDLREQVDYNILYCVRV